MDLRKSKGKQGNFPSSTRSSTTHGAKSGTPAQRVPALGLTAQQAAEFSDFFLEGTTCRNSGLKHIC